MVVDKIKDLIGVNYVNLEDDFFRDLGGDSLTALSLSSSFSGKITVYNIFTSNC